MSMAGVWPWHSQTTARMVMTPSGRKVPRMTPYCAILLKVFTPFVARKQQNQ